MYNRHKIYRIQLSGLGLGGVIKLQFLPSSVAELALGFNALTRVDVNGLDTKSLRSLRLQMNEIQQFDIRRMARARSKYGEIHVKST